MSIRTFRKALGLLLADIVIIIGIFVLQFRTDSNIIEKIGNLQVTLTKVENNIESNSADFIEDQPVQLMNKFRASYNGLTLYCDEKNPVTIKDVNGGINQLTLESWEKVNDSSCVFKFSNNVNVTLELNSETPETALAIITDFPKEYKEIFIPYSFSSDMQITKEEQTNIVLNKKKNTWEISAAGFDNGAIGIRDNNLVATYSIFEETKEFTFDSVISLPIADRSIYDLNVTSFKNNLINAYNSNTNVNNITEQVAVSYVAAMAESGRYTLAIESVPQAVKKSKDRTYLSAPYFNTLEVMNEKLDQAVETYEQKISESAASGSLDIFTVHNIANFMTIHPNPGVVKNLLENASNADPASMSLAQATGIIQVFVDLYEMQPDYASILSSVVKGCVDRIAHSCVYDNNVLTISENDTFLSVIQAVETGVAVMRYGLVTENDSLQKAGYVIINSYLAESSSFDLRTLANLYPLLAFDNPYYPHFQKLGTVNGKPLWAWTCAENIEYTGYENGDMNLAISFPEGDTHYIIMKGVTPFKSIYIYDMLFRTDYRFETYNSSGYVYKEKTKTLLLKSRHKKNVENVRIELTSKAPPVSKEKTVETTTETSAEPGASKDEEIKETDLKDESNAGDKAVVPASSDEKAAVEKN